MTTLDILLPYYGDFGLLRLAVDSIIGQTDPNFRLLVVDDGYPDPEVAAWFAGMEDGRVEYHRNETNLGANANYRKALFLSRADYFVVMGADDLMLPNYVAMIRRIISESVDVDMIQPGVATIDQSGRRVVALADRIKRSMTPSTREPVRLAGEALAVSLLRGNWTYFPSICWKRSTVMDVGFRTDLNVVQDLALILDIVRRDGTLLLDPELAFLYRRHSGSDSTVRALTGSRFQEERRFFENAASDFSERGWRRASLAARVHITSRLNAASLLPAAVRAKRFSSAKTLATHVVR